MCLQFFNIQYYCRYLPKSYQAILASATLSEDVLELKKLLLRNAIILKLQEPDLAPLSQLSHYKLNAEEEDKAVILYCCFKLKLVKGKILVFVNTVDKCYKLVQFFIVCIYYLRLYNNNFFLQIKIIFRAIWHSYLCIKF